MDANEEWKPIGCGGGVQKNGMVIIKGKNTQTYGMI